MQTRLPSHLTLASSPLLLQVLTAGKLIQAKREVSSPVHVTRSRKGAVPRLKKCWCNATAPTNPHKTECALSH